MTWPTSSTAKPLRLGILGAARIVPTAVIEPARQIPSIKILAIAARDPVRAQRFAAAHRIPRVHATYDELLDDPDIEAVYIPLPNALHRPWTIAALNAGKHVLCEKPLAANAHEALQMVAAGRANRLVLMEAFHYAFHPLARQIRATLERGDIGPVRHVETSVCIPLLRPGDIRLQFDLAGGATMDVGCYALHMARYFTGQEPAIVRAKAARWSGQVDRAMDAELRFPDGATGRMACSLLSRRLLSVHVTIIGEHGRLQAINPVLPHHFNRLTIATGQSKWTQTVSGESTYTYQLRAFEARVRACLAGDHENIQDAVGSPNDAVANMRLIDGVYDAAGLARRGSLDPSP